MANAQNNNRDIVKNTCSNQNIRVEENGNNGQITNAIRLFRTLVFLGLMTTISCSSDKAANSGSNLPDGSLESTDKLTSPKTSVSINRLPQIENLDVIENGNEHNLSFDIVDDNTSVDIAVYGRKSTNEDYVNISDLFNGDIGGPITVGTAKTIISSTLEEYNELQLRVTDLTAFKMDVVKAVSKDRIMHDIQQMNGIRHYTTPLLINKTRTYIMEEFEKYRLEGSMHSFSWNTVAAANVIGHHKGEDNHNGGYIICAHFDSVRDTPGADDNASGTSGVLEAMRILSQYEFESSIHFVGFDLEEQGLIGSQRYVNEIAKNQDILGVINFEMIGYPCRSEICENLQLPDTSIYNIALPAFDAIRTKFDTMGNKYVPELKITSVIADDDPNFRRSDHAPFWSANIPALFITDGANFRNPHYHQNSDTPETLDYDFAKNIVATAVLTIMDLAKVNRTTYVSINL
ncbi:MAG: M28 family peptidase [Flavobacteriaceae bacterium]